MNYMVVLFKNKVRKKIINKFVTLDKAEEFFNKKIEEKLEPNELIVYQKEIENYKVQGKRTILLEKTLQS